MLQLPKRTELNKQLPKKAIYAKFNLQTAAKEKFDADISRMVIVNEVSPSTTTIAKGEQVDAFFVVHVSLKKKDFDSKNITLISKLINQKMLFVLQYENEAKLALYQSTLLLSEWEQLDVLSVQLDGLNFDRVWDKIVQQIAQCEVCQVWNEELSTDENIVQNERVRKLQKKIDLLERQARAEKQPRRKLDLVEEIRLLQKEIK